MLYSKNSMISQSIMCISCNTDFLYFGTFLFLCYSKLLTRILMTNRPGVPEVGRLSRDSGVAKVSGLSPPGHLFPDTQGLRNLQGRAPQKHKHSRCWAMSIDLSARQRIIAAIDEDHVGKLWALLCRHLWYARAWWRWAAAVSCLAASVIGQKRNDGSNGIIVRV